jgi:TolA-binding protein
LIAPAILASVVAVAQVDQEREETTVESYGLDEEPERPNLAEEAAEGPTTSVLSLEREVDIEEIERTETALSRLRRLVEDTPAQDVSRAEYMFRLAELYYDRARYYEQRAYRRRDEAFELRELHPQRARAYEENAQADLEQSDAFASEAINLYADIYSQYRDSYPDIDAVLYYLGANMLQLGQNEAARMVFEDLALNHPQSAYLPQALLMLGELLWAEGDAAEAQMYYEAVTQFPDSSVYPYALYKLAWCAYNLAEDDDDYEHALQLLYDAVLVTEEGESSSRIRLRRDALRDMALFYSEVYPADLALEFFEEIAPDEAFDLVSRLARIYGDRADYRDANTLYRTLIGLNTESFDIVDYQREIVRNTRPMADDVELVRETRRLVELYELAMSFEDAEPERVRRTGGQIELLLRQLATTYHSEAQTTQNEELYALAFALYQDYTSAFPESEHAYAMWFYFAELLYRNEEWLQAAEAYERALSLSTSEKNQYDQEATHAACLAYANMVDLSEGARGTADVGDVTVDEADLAPTPDPMEIPREYQRMMDACDLYLATGPEAERAAEIEYVIAYTYYDHYHLDEAVSRFATIATERTRYDAERGRVSAELLLDSLNQQRRYEDMKLWIDRFKANPAINVGSFAVQLQTLSEQIDFIQCNGRFADREYEEAGHCYIAFVESHFESELMCRGLYNAGLAFDRGGKFDFSISAMRYLQQYCPDDPLAPETTYQLGQTFFRMGMYTEAADQFREYAENNPRGENVRDALINESKIRAGLGDHGGAVTALNAFIRASDDDEAEERAAIAEAYFQIGVVEMERQRYSDSIDAFERVIRRHADDVPGRMIESHIRIARMHEARGDADEADRGYEETLEAWDDLDAEARAALPSSARDAAAEAQFMLAERVFAEFESIPLEGSEQEVQAAIERKIALGRDANALYTLVVERFARPGWSIAAFTRVGQLYHVFYEQIIDAPIPEGLTPIQVEAYQVSIEAQAEEQKSAAMGFYADAILIAREFGWFSDYSEQAASLYQELDPTFRAGSEIRIEPGLDAGTGPFASPWVLPEGMDEPEEDAVAPAPEAMTEPATVEL